MLMEARLPRDKISKFLLLLEQFLHHKKVTLRELRSLIELLIFACYVIVPGRAFLRPLGRYIILFVAIYFEAIIHTYVQAGLGTLYPIFLFNFRCCK